jgi:hypothetical protein
MVVNDPDPTVHIEKLRPLVVELIQQLQSGDPPDFCRIAARPSDPGDRLLALLWRDRDAYRALARDRRAGAAAPVETQVFESWIAWVYERNQFFDLDSRRTNALARAQRVLFANVQARLEKAASVVEFASLCQWSYLRYAGRLARVLRSLAAPEGLRGLGAEYSAELQRKLLGLTDHAWREPIVDLGCGIEARLVQDLRERGLEATGIERRGRAAFIVAKDWFDVHFEPESLGTVISHLAFSLQFLHHHWRPGDRAYDYARKYMEILRSLIKGGRFCYAPGLPFIEDMIDQTKYQVTTLPLPEPLASTLGSLRDLGTGRSVAYACQVRRR